jgi:hypothetical protein
MAHFQNGLSDTILKGTHSGTIPARFGLIWFSGFRGEDLNVIFYQNMPNLHNRYISAERKTFKSSPLKPLNQIKPNLAGMVPEWVPFKIVSDSPALHSRWPLLLKIEHRVKFGNNSKTVNNIRNLTG